MSILIICVCLKWSGQRLFTMEVILIGIGDPVKGKTSGAFLKEKNYYESTINIVPYTEIVKVSLD
jgi:hypothetical protein